MKGQFHIESISAFIMRDDDGTEGVMGVLTANGWLPLVAADEARIKSFEPMVQQMVSAMKKPAVLARFSKREDVRTIEINRSDTSMGGVRLGPDGSNIGIIRKAKKNDG